MAKQYDATVGKIEKVPKDIQWIVKMKSREKTRQVWENWSQQLEH